MKPISRLFSAAGLAIGLMMAPVAAPASAEPPAKAEAASGAILVANVNGLVCDFCVQSIRKIVGKDDAVQKVQVDLSKGTVRIDLKPGKTLSDAALEKLIRKSGYTLVSVDRSAAL